MEGADFRLEPGVVDVERFFPPKWHAESGLLYALSILVRSVRPSKPAAAAASHRRRLATGLWRRRRPEEKSSRWPTAALAFRLWSVRRRQQRF